MRLLLGFLVTVLIFVSLGSVPISQAQVSITVNQTEPCFLNYTAGIDMFENCGFGDDYIQAALLPWQWITGGWFSMILVSIFVLMSYIKYHKAVYPLLIGLMFLPIAFFVFPDEFLTFAFLMTGVLLAILMWWAYIRQTKEYGT